MVNQVMECDHIMPDGSPPQYHAGVAQREGHSDGTLEWLPTCQPNVIAGACVTDRP